MARTIEIHEISKPLKSYIQSGHLNFIIGSGASLPLINLMGDIETEINNLLLEEKNAEADRRALEFLQELETKNEEIKEAEDESDAKISLNNYYNFISVVDEILFERKNDLLSRQANIFTTNYDLLMEFTASQMPSLILNDGFDRKSSIDTSFKYSPELFQDRTFRSGSLYNQQSEVPTLNLFKIHGSLNWQRSADNITLMHGMPPQLGDKELEDASKVEEALEKRVLILPNLRKFGSTLLERVYYDLLRFYSNSIQKENAVLISFGFSFVDDHILDITKRALRNPTSQLILFAFSNADVEAFSQKFAEQRNALIVVPGEGEFINFGTFSHILRGVLGDRER